MRSLLDMAQIDRLSWVNTSQVIHAGLGAGPLFFRKRRTVK